jgi:hypothetical protein
LTSRLEELKFNWANGELNASIYGDANELIELLIKENDALYNQLERQEQAIDRRKL